MKQIILAASVLTLSLNSCTQTIIVHPPENQASTAYGQTGATPSRARLYSNNPDAAFDQQVEAYAHERNGGHSTAVTPAVTPVQQLPSVQPPAQPEDSYIPPPRPVTPQVSSPAVTNPVTAPSQTTPSVSPTVTAPALATQPAHNQNSGTMDYKIKITNGTTNRLFIEAQDAKGNIYPCGFMLPGQSETTKMDRSPAVAGPVLIVVRDPDQPDAPELRRYRIATPNAAYANKTLHFTIIPKGRYSAAIDDQVYYASESDE